MDPRVDPDDLQPDETEPGIEAPGSLADVFDMPAVVKGLLQDLRDLRAGKISVARARASAELGKAAIRGMSLMVQAQKVLIEQAKPAPQPRRNSKQIEGRADG